MYLFIDYSHLHVDKVVVVPLYTKSIEIKDAIINHLVLLNNNN